MPQLPQKIDLSLQRLSEPNAWLASLLGVNESSSGEVDWRSLSKIAVGPMMVAADPLGGIFQVVLPSQ